MSSPDRPRRFSIGLYAGRSPVELAPVPEIPHPVLTGGDVADPPAHSVADPFLLRHDGLWHLFFQASTGKRGERGEIALAVSEDLRSWDVRGRVLAEPGGVSYPHVVCSRGEIYMVPELAGQNAVRLYRAEAFPHRWAPVATLIDGVPMASMAAMAAPTPFHHGDSWWMFVCITPATPDRHDELRLFRADDLTGPWEEHPASPVVQGDTARPAGRVVEGAGGPIRFALDSHDPLAPMAPMATMAAFEITTLTRDDYAERPLGCPLETPAEEAEGTWSGRPHHVDAHRLADGAWVALVDGPDHPPAGE